MDHRMQSVMDSLWDFAPSPVTVMNEPEEAECEGKPTTYGDVPSWFMPMFSQRWIVAIIATLFLCWLWYSERRDTDTGPPATTTPPPAPATSNE